MFNCNLYAQTGKIIISGKVVDSLGVALDGVTVSVDDATKTSTITDKSGFFSISVRQGVKVSFTLLGYKAYSLVATSTNESLTIIMDPQGDEIEEVVVSAFGKVIRKEALVGSVTTISPKELKVPSSNLTTALAGRLAGVISYQRSGEPGADNAQFFIRGVTTFGVNNVPLILIDNVELTATDLARLQPDDIESFSILKDASATALYGSRGANGVILVTTKLGKIGKASLNVRLENSFSQPTQMVKVVDPITHMRLYSEAQLTRGDLNLKYSPIQIDNTLLGDNPVLYPKTDWQDLMFKDQTSNQRFNLDISGGGDVAQYYVSGTWNRDNGILEVPQYSNFNNNIRLTTYGLRSNVSINITPITKFFIRLSGSFDDYNGPIESGADLFIKSLRTSPTAYAPFYAPDEANQFTKHILFGNYNNGEYLNPYADMVKGYRESASSRVIAQFELNQDLNMLLNGLNFRGLMSVNRYADYSNSRQYNPFYYNISDYDVYTKKYVLNHLNNVTGSSAPTEFLNFLQGAKSVSSYLYSLGSLNYNRSINDIHTIGASLIGTIEQTANPNSFDLQGSLPSRNMGVSGSATYGYDRRYYAEFNFGYNGSERFYEDKRFGFFPVVGLSWVISNEKFFKKDIINNLKLRATYGKAGNDAIGTQNQRFFYLSKVEMDDFARAYSFGYGLGNQYSTPGISVSAYENKDITWEVSKDMNVALELGVKNALNITAEYYVRNRSNILMQRVSTPSTLGLAINPFANIGAAKTQGTDISVDYTKNYSNGLYLALRGNFTYSSSKYVKYEEPVRVNEPWLSRVGQQLGQNWGFIAERLFIDDQDVLNSPTQSFGIYEAGDIKYSDINGDGLISSLDVVPIGLPTTPEIIYGFGFTASYKGFDLSAFFQGSARSSFWISPVLTAPFVNLGVGGVGENSLIQEYADSHWSEENQDIYAMWPRLSTNVINNNIQTSTWFMRNGAFLRMKSAELGYTLNDKLTKKFKMKGLRIYLNGTNLLSFSKFKMWDIEMGGDGLKYPVQRVGNIGIRASF